MYGYPHFIDQDTFFSLAEIDQETDILLKQRVHTCMPRSIWTAGRELCCIFQSWLCWCTSKIIRILFSFLFSKRFCSWNCHFSSSVVREICPLRKKLLLGWMNTLNSSLRLVERNNKWSLFSDLLGLGVPEPGGRLLRLQVRREGRELKWLSVKRNRARRNGCVGSYC